ncbi:MAG: hypothetical protein DHS20C01_13810 [marine bacterium B5-7]|nr:MAG: hypothetical protein DHS20C01_13810 [marine bacterium B5-7]
MRNFDFDNLFILDLANNHQGDVKHALNIISSIGKVVRDHEIRATIKFQFRQLDTFIHPASRESSDNKHIPRFISTRLEKSDYATLAKAVKDEGMITMATPFDEESLDVIGDLGIEVIKVASCSASDTPLLEQISTQGKPVVASTAGLTITQIDNLVNLFDLRGVEYAVMHCVAIYPTPLEKLKLNQIELLRFRYPGIPIGFSTHEDPDNYLPVRIAVAKGAKLFERHVGMNTDKYKLNAYSSDADQVNNWIIAYKEAREICGGENRSPATPEEISSLKTLQRGVFAKSNIKKGAAINRQQVYFAMPWKEGSLSSGKWHDGMVADKDYAKDEALSETLAKLDPSHSQIIHGIVLQIKGLLNNARIVVGPESSVEISHHYGLDRFREFGAVIIDCVNREYCKKLLVMLPRQKHPYHYHKRKEETFQLLFGDMEIEADGHVTRMKPGDTFLVKPGTWHKFHTLDGAIVEEVSTTHYKNDSFYEDEQIARLNLEERKTRIPSLGRVVGV